MTHKSAPTLGHCDAPLISSHDALLLDLDGVVRRGLEPIGNAPQTIAAATKAGVRTAYVTNNASLAPSAVTEQLRSMGVAAEDEQIMTASLAAAAMLRQHVAVGSRVLCVGGAGLVEAMTDAGYVVVTSAQDAPEAVVQGWAADVAWPQLSEAAYAIENGAFYLATNLDATLPTERGLAVGNGSLVAAVVNATGVRPISSGKPEVGIFHAAAALVGASQPLSVGDRLDTDIAGSLRAGYPAMVVLTGVAQPGDLLRAVPEQRPTFVAPDLSGVLAAHPAVVPDGEAWRCGRGVATADGRLVRPDGATAIAQVAQLSLDELRAACVAAWAAADAGRPWALEGVSPRLDEPASAADQETV